MVPYSELVTYILLAKNFIIELFLTFYNKLTKQSTNNKTTKTESMNNKLAKKLMNKPKQMICSYKGLDEVIDRMIHESNHFFF